MKKVNIKEYCIYPMLCFIELIVSYTIVNISLMWAILTMVIPLLNLSYPQLELYFFDLHNIKSHNLWTSLMISHEPS